MSALVSIIIACYNAERRVGEAIRAPGRRGAGLEAHAELNPDSPQVLHMLGLAEQANHQFYAAGNDLSRAAEFAPDDAVIKADYAEFQKNAAANSGMTDAATATP